MKFATWLNGLAADSSPDGSSDYIVEYDASAGASKKVLINNLPTSGGGIDETGWVASGETWTYASADDPTYTLTISGDKTAKYSAGMRVKLTQTTVRYFIITKVVYSDPNTTLTLYGGTDYDLDNAAITSPNYSVVKAPVGFPLDPTKWTVRVTDTVLRAQATPTQNIWYNLGAITISLPIGAWHTRVQVVVDVSRTDSGIIQIRTTLSTANNSESDIDWTTVTFVQAAVSGTVRVMQPIHRSKTMVVATKTSHYLNAMTPTASQTTIDFRGDLSTTIIEAVSAYL